MIKALRSELRATRSLPGVGAAFFPRDAPTSSRELRPLPAPPDVRVESGHSLGVTGSISPDDDHSQSHNNGAESPFLSLGSGTTTPSARSRAREETAADIVMARYYVNRFSDTLTAESQLYVDALLQAKRDKDTLGRHVEALERRISTLLSERALLEAETRELLDGLEASPTAAPSQAPVMNTWNSMEADGLQQDAAAWQLHICLERIAGLASVCRVRAASKVITALRSLPWQRKPKLENQEQLPVTSPIMSSGWNALRQSYHQFSRAGSDTHASKKMGTPSNHPVAATTMLTALFRSQASFMTMNDSDKHLQSECNESRSQGSVLTNAERGEKVISALPSNTRRNQMAQLLEN